MLVFFLMVHVLIIFQVRSTTSFSCMSRRFPRMIGSDSGNTEIERFQLDSFNNIIIGGKTSDSSFISTASPVFI